MPSWRDIQVTSKEDLMQFNVELNRRLRYYLANIDISQIIFNLNDIGGTLNLSKGGTGTSLTAPTSDALFGYDLSSGTAVFYGIGSGLALSGTTLTASGSFKINVETITASTTITDGGVYIANSTGAITVNLVTAVGNSGVSFFLTNSNSGTVTLDANSTETIQGALTVDIYKDENINIVSDGSNYYIR